MRRFVSIFMPLWHFTDWIDNSSLQGRFQNCLIGCLIEMSIMYYKLKFMVNFITKCTEYGTTSNAVPQGGGGGCDGSGKLSWVCCSLALSLSLSCHGGFLWVHYHHMRWVLFVKNSFVWLWKWHHYSTAWIRLTHRYGMAYSISSSYDICSIECSDECGMVVTVLVISIIFFFLSSCLTLNKSGNILNQLVASSKTSLIKFFSSPTKIYKLLKMNSVEIYWHIG